MKGQEEGGPRDRGGWWTRWGLMLLGVVIAFAGLGWWLVQEQAVPLTPDASAPEPRTEVVRGNVVPEAAPAPTRPGAPRSVRIPALDIDAEVLPIAAPGGVLTPPSDPQRLGWWADGARPGDQRGSALVTGHTVSTGGGALDDLEKVAVGEPVFVRSARTTIDYRVDRVRIYTKGRLSEQAKRLFDQSVPGRLVLITCEDWNGVEYLSNVVVTATPRTR